MYELNEWFALLYRKKCMLVHVYLSIVTSVCVCVKLQF